MDPVTQQIFLGTAGAAADETWFRANVRSTNRYTRYAEGDNIYPVYDDDHVYFVYSVQVMYNGSNGYRTDRLEIWKVKKKDGTTIWHKSYENVSGAYEVLQLDGCDISPDGNYLVVSGTFNKEGINYGNYSNFRYGFCELSTADGTLRTTANGALYAGGVKDDHTSGGDERNGGILYKPGSSTDFLIPGNNNGPAYGGFALVSKGASSYTTTYHVDTYNQSPFNDYQGGNNTPRSIVRDPDISTYMWLHQQDYYNSDYYNYFLLYDVSGNSPTYITGIRLRGSDFDGRAMFTSKYHASNDIDLYTYVEKASTYSRVTKFNWNGSSWSAEWQNELNVSNGGYGARNCQVLTYDDDNDRLVVFEADPPNTYIVRQINPSTGANVTVRRIAISDDNSRTNWNMSSQNTNGLALVNGFPNKNSCNRAIDGYFYASLMGSDDYYDKHKGHMAFKLSTDISELPSTLTIYNTVNNGNSYGVSISLAISGDDPGGSYNVRTSSFQGDWDNIASHSPDLYGVGQGPMNYYNWNESTCDEWITADTNRWPSDSQITID